MAKVYKVIAKVPAKVPSPNKNVAVSARISAGKERRTWMRIRRTLRGAAGNFRVCRGKGSSRNGEKRSQYGTSHRHLYGIKKGQKDFSDIGKIWWDHVCHKIGKMAPALPEGSEVTASKPGQPGKTERGSLLEPPIFWHCL